MCMCAAQKACPPRVRRTSSSSLLASLNSTEQRARSHARTRRYTRRYSTRVNRQRDSCVTLTRAARTPTHKTKHKHSLARARARSATVCNFHSRTQNTCARTVCVCVCAYVVYNTVYIAVCSACARTLCAIIRVIRSHCNTKKCNVSACCCRS